MPRKFRLSVHRKNELRKAVLVQCLSNASVAPAAVCVASDQSTSPRSVKEVVSVPIDLKWDFQITTVTKLKRE